MTLKLRRHQKNLDRSRCNADGERVRRKSPKSRSLSVWPKMNLKSKHFIKSYPKKLQLGKLKKRLVPKNSKFGQNFSKNPKKLTWKRSSRPPEPIPSKLRKTRTSLRHRCPLTKPFDPSTPCSSPKKERILRNKTISTKYKKASHCVVSKTMISLFFNSPNPRALYLR